MAVTDLTDSLPWWARSGVGAPGPTGGPGATPQGGADPSQPPPGVDPAQWLQYLYQMAGLGSANAATANPHGEGPPDTTSPQQMYNFRHPPPINQPGPGQVAPVNLNEANIPGPPAGPPGAMPARPATGMGMQPGGLSSGALGAFNNMPTPSGGGGAVSVQQAFPNPNAPAANAQPVSAAAPAATVPGPMATGGAAGTGATSNPRLIGIDRPNADPTARRGSPQGTALNLAGLFGGGQPAAPLAAAPGARPQVAGPLAGGGMVPSTYPGDNWDIDAQGNVVPNYGSTTGPLQRPPKSSVARARILAPNYYG